MTIDLSNPVWYCVGVLVGALVLVGFSFYIKGILIDANVESARRIRAEQEDEKKRNKPDLGRRI